MSQFRKAEKRKAKLRLGLVGPAGSGKTYSALRLAKGLGGRVALIDTESGSGDLYASSFDYDVLQLGAPFTAQKYLDAITAAESEGYDVIILDSISHLWAGEGGLLDLQGKVAGMAGKNSYTAWRDVTPLHNRFIDRMLGSKCHVIATMRAKTEYVLEDNGHGKMAPKKVGMAPVQREGLDFEFSLVFSVDASHNAQASKDRTSLFPPERVIQLGEDVGRELSDWLNDGTEPPKPKCDNCFAKGIEADASVEADGRHFCAGCAARYEEIKKSKSQPVKAE